MLSVSVQDALAATLVDEGLSLLDAPGGAPPLATEVWLDERGCGGHRRGDHEEEEEEEQTAALPLVQRAHAEAVLATTARGTAATATAPLARQAQAALAPPAAAAPAPSGFAAPLPPARHGFGLGLVPQATSAAGTPRDGSGAASTLERLQPGAA